MRGSSLFTWLLIVGLLVGGCVAPAPPGAPSGTATKPVSQTIIADFEKPAEGFTWLPLAGSPVPQMAPQTQAASQPASPMQRTALRPHAGLWSMSLSFTQAGDIRFVPAKPLDLGSMDLLSAQVTHAGAPGDNGQVTAALVLTDADGRTARGDAFPITSHWQAISFDLKRAFDDGLDISRIVSISLALRQGSTLPAEGPLLIQTDTWKASTNARTYLGSADGTDKSFYIDGRGLSLRIGSVGQYEITLSDRGAPFTPPPAAENAGVDLSKNAAPLPWMSVASGTRHAVGQPVTGLVLLDQSGLDALGNLRRQDADDSPMGNTLVVGRVPDEAWPASLNPNLNSIHWEVAWSSPVGAIIEGAQEAGPFDRLGEPAVSVKWRLMVYQWGQVFVDARWTKSSEFAVPVPDPISWALLLEDAPRASAPAAGESPDRLLSEIYTAPFRQGLQTALPHRMQTDAPVAMIAGTTPQKNTWWWATGPTPASGRRRAFGAGFNAAGGPTGEATCMLLVNDPNALMKAATFGQYVDPAKVVVKQGELDRNFPGDADNDGFVETYGFQVVRLTNGSAMFTIYPQERPILYPPFLFTIPAAEREALDVKHSKLLINIDGKQFANPPQFPDGSFLLQIPYVLDRPVTVEAILVK
ncbi:MAG TPA: hypothetical protein VGN88_02790 [Phycisphaerae bacterium]|jgi:hypothetical protein